MANLVVKSRAFESGKPIPLKYSCDGQEVNPPLMVQGIPAETKTLALVIDDPDAHAGTFDHWVVFNIQPKSEIAENSVPGTEGVNSARQHGYVGMCPPGGMHRYFFKVYALDMHLDLKPQSATKNELERAMQGHILAKGELVGTYSRGK